MSYQINKRGLTGEFTFVWMEDPALQVTKDGKLDVDGIIERHRLFEDHDDDKHLQILPGKAPVRWTLRYLSAKELRHARDIIRRGEQDTAVYKMAAMAIVGTDAKTEDGKRIEFKQTPDAHGFLCAPDWLLESLDKSEDTQGLLDAIGLTAWRRSTPGPK